MPQNVFFFFSSSFTSFRCSLLCVAEASQLCTAIKRLFGATWIIIWNTTKKLLRQWAEKREIDEREKVLFSFPRISVRLKTKRTKERNDEKCRVDFIVVIYDANGLILIRISFCSLLFRSVFMINRMQCDEYEYKKWTIFNTFSDLFSSSIYFAFAAYLYWIVSFGQRSLSDHQSSSFSWRRVIMAAMESVRCTLWHHTDQRGVIHRMTTNHLCFSLPFNGHKHTHVENWKKISPRAEIYRRPVKWFFGHRLKIDDGFSLCRCHCLFSF